MLFKQQVSITIMIQIFIFSKNSENDQQPQQNQPVSKRKNLIFIPDA